MHFCIYVVVDTEMKFEHGSIDETGVAVQYWL